MSWRTLTRSRVRTEVCRRNTIAKLDLSFQTYHTPPSVRPRPPSVSTHPRTLFFKTTPSNDPTPPPPLPRRRSMSTQAAFRGYRLRDRLRRLPAREAEKTIRALHANDRGFRRLALFLVFSGLYFSLVFGGADVAFQRSVQQGLRDHLALVREAV